MTVWSFALTDDGSLHIIEGELPEAANVVVVEIVDRGGGLHVISADHLQPLRQLLGTPSIKTIVREAGPQAAAELEDALQRITTTLQTRIDELRGEDDEPDFGR